MTFILKDRVRETTTITGTGDVILNGAVAGYRAFQSVMVNGDTTWYAIVLPAGAWETGIGTWVTGNHLQRTTLIDSSTGSFISFAAGTKDVFIALPASKGNALNNAFQSGTLMPFQQTSAPLYWTKQVTHNNKALRVVSGTASSGGSNSFSSVLNTTLGVSNTTITNATSASHAHNNGLSFTGFAAATGLSVGHGQVDNGTGIATNSVGSDGAHNHVFNLDVAYVDLILASKD